MFNRSSSVVFVLSPLVLALIALPSMIERAPSGQKVALAVSANPIAFDVTVATVIRPLDLAKLTNADFGDVDTLN